MFSLSVDFSNTQSASLTCHYYDHKDCQEKGLCHQTNETCTTGEICYAAWQNFSGNVSLWLKGCLFDGENKCQRPTCKFGTILNDDRSMYMCCCNADFCNDELGVVPKGKDDGNTQMPEETSKLAEYF